MNRIRLGFGIVGGTWMKHVVHVGNKSNEIIVDFNPKDWELLKFETKESVITW